MRDAEIAAITTMTSPRSIVLDPGHGGDVNVGGSSPNNATGPFGTLEKNLTLAVALAAVPALEAAGHRVTLTRDSDRNLGLDDRAAVARTAEADVFVSIHFNGFGDPLVQGTETWVHFLAADHSRELAERVQQHVLGATGYSDRGVRAKKLRVLTPALHRDTTAACLAEISFLTDPRDERRLADAAHIEQLGAALAAGIVEYLALAVRAPGPAAARASAAARSLIQLNLGGRRDPIEHVVVLMLENQSFDHMLGALREHVPDLDGIDPARPGRNTDPLDGGRVYEQAPTSTTALEPDPKHELSHVQRQLDFDGLRCGGFVADFRMAYNTPRHVTREVMAYYPFGALPVMHRLAAEFTICDRWFSSVPGPTWTNRLFVHSGTAQGRVEMPDPPFDLNLHAYDQDTLYDRLNERGIAWRIYYGDVPQSLVLAHQRQLRNALRYRPFARFEQDAAGSADDFPAYVFIEPSYFFNQNDQHPPSDVHKGEVLLARVYNALRANDELWARTLLVLVYDEHGGFYDHVYPGPAVPPDDDHDEYTFDQFGLRVPAILISPWLAAGVCKTELDHTSLLKYVSDKWRLGPLGARTLHANSFANQFLSQPRTSTPRRLGEPDIPQARAALAVPRREPPLNDLQRSLLAMTEMLEAETPQPLAAKAMRARRTLDGPQAQAQVANERVERFLTHRRNRRTSAATRRHRED